MRAEALRLSLSPERLPAIVLVKAEETIERLDTKIPARPAAVRALLRQIALGNVKRAGSIDVPLFSSKPDHSRVPFNRRESKGTDTSLTGSFSIVSEFRVGRFDFRPCVASRGLPISREFYSILDPCNF